MMLPPVDEYVRALRIVLPATAESHLKMLDAHAAAEGGVITASRLAEAAGYANYKAANLQYGRFCHRLCDELGFVPPIGNSGEPTYTYVLASPGKIGAADWEWTLHDRFIEALKLVRNNQLNTTVHSAVFADEVKDPERYIEGAKKLITVLAYERSDAARDACLDYWGTECSACGLDFESAYGVQAIRCIHVHHLVPLSTIGQSYEVNPIADLRPVCPNCHTVLHSMNPPMEIAELRKILRGGINDDSQEKS